MALQPQILFYVAPGGENRICLILRYSPNG